MEALGSEHLCCARTAHGEVGEGVGSCIHTGDKKWEVDVSLYSQRELSLGCAGSRASSHMPLCMPAMASLCGTVEADVSATKQTNHPFFPTLRP